MSAMSRGCLLFMMLLSAVARAQCPEPSQEAAVGVVQRGGETWRMQLCWSAGADGGRLRAVVDQRAQQIAEASFAVEAEGEVTRIRFDPAAYALSPRLPTFAVLIETRLRGNGFDQYGTDLWLLTLDGGRLKKVLAHNVAWETWATQCESDCIDTARSRTVVIVSPQKSARGLSDLRLRTRGTSTPHDGGKARVTDQTTRYAFDGESYVPQD